jgi:hypothetical protein
MGWGPAPHHKRGALEAAPGEPRRQPHGMGRIRAFARRIRDAAGGLPQTTQEKDLMGTLFNQQRLVETLSGNARSLYDALELMGIKSADATHTDWTVACDIVRTLLAVQSADVLDEQLGGFGEILQELVRALEAIAGAVEAHET